MGGDYLSYIKEKRYDSFNDSGGDNDDSSFTGYGYGMERRQMELINKLAISLLVTLVLTGSSYAMRITDDMLIHLPFAYGYGITAKTAGMSDMNIRLSGFGLCLAKEVADEFRKNGSGFDVAELACGMIGVEIGLRAGNWAINFNPHLIEVSTLW